MDSLSKLFDSAGQWEQERIEAKAAREQVEAEERNYANAWRNVIISLSILSEAEEECFAASRECGESPLLNALASTESIDCEPFIKLADLLKGRGYFAWVPDMQANLEINPTWPPERPGELLILSLIAKAGEPEVSPDAIEQELRTAVPRIGRLLVGWRWVMECVDNIRQYFSHRVAAARLQAEREAAKAAEIVSPIAQPMPVQEPKATCLPITSPTKAAIVLADHPRGGPPEILSVDQVVAILGISRKRFDNLRTPKQYPLPQALQGDCLPFTAWEQWTSAVPSMRGKFPETYEIALAMLRARQG